jgi:hypothetical protein
LNCCSPSILYWQEQLLSVLHILLLDKRSNTTDTIVLFSYRWHTVHRPNTVHRPKCSKLLHTFGKKLYWVLQRIPSMLFLNSMTDASTFCYVTNVSILLFMCRHILHTSFLLLVSGIPLSVHLGIKCSDLFSSSFLFFIYTNF